MELWHALHSQTKWVLQPRAGEQVERRPVNKSEEKREDSGPDHAEAVGEVRSELDLRGQRPILLFFWELSETRILLRLLPNVASPVHPRVQKICNPSAQNAQQNDWRDPTGLPCDILKRRLGAEQCAKNPSKVIYWVLRLRCHRRRSNHRELPPQVVRVPTSHTHAQRRIFQCGSISQDLTEDANDLRRRHFRDCCEQCLGIRMRGPIEDSFGSAALPALSALHHGHPRRDVRHNE